MVAEINIRYRLIARQNYIFDQPIIIRFILENNSDRDYWILKWYTPFEGLKGKIFLITCDGIEIPYHGPMVKRGDPRLNDYIHAVRGCIFIDINFSKAYSIPSCDKCLVNFNGRIYDIAKTGDSIPRPRDQHYPINVIGNTVTLRIIQR